MIAQLEFLPYTGIPCSHTMQNIVLLGATGSIGEQTLDIVRNNHGLFKVVGMSAHKNEQGLLKLADQFECDRLFLAGTDSQDSRIVTNADDLIDESVDHLIVADHGLGSFQVVLKALTLGKRVSIANKELIIVHGSDLLYLAQEQQAECIPLDSEHNALFQCLQGERRSDVEKMIITASGGPFRTKSWDQLKDVTADQVLDHPNWSMGNKTTVDSATLVNKAFEVIETHILFDIPYENIEVKIHSQSIVHGMVLFKDGNCKMLAYAPDMSYSLGYALFLPERSPLNLASDKNQQLFDQDLHFEALTEGRYPCFDFVVDTATKTPEKLPQVLMNDAQAVEKFLSGECNFHDILDELQQGI